MMTDTTLLETIAKKSPELLKNLSYITEVCGAYPQKGWYARGCWIFDDEAIDLLCWAMVKDMWASECSLKLYNRDGQYRTYIELHGRHNGGDTPLAALYAVWLARGKT